MSITVEVCSIVHGISPLRSNDSDSVRFDTRCSGRRRKTGVVNEKWLLLNRGIRNLVVAGYLISGSGEGGEGC